MRNDNGGRIGQGQGDDAYYDEIMTVTHDHILGGALSLTQAETGYRAGLDAALLAAACDAHAGMRVLEAGCGVGGALLAAAHRCPQARFVGIERDPDALALAQANIADNALHDRVKATLGDVATPFSRLGELPFDAVLANPPFFDDAGALRGPAAAKRGAWIADDGWPVWAAFLLKAVREGGTITVIHRADRLADILATLAPKAGSFRIRPVHPFADSPAKRILVRATKTGKAPLILAPPLVLHERGGGKHTEEVEAILRGEAGLAWL